MAPQKKRQVEHGLKRVPVLPGFEKLYHPDDFYPESTYRGSLTIGSFKSSVNNFALDIGAVLGGKAVGLVAPVGGFNKNACGIYYGMLNIDGITYDARIARLPVQATTVAAAATPFPFAEYSLDVAEDEPALYSLVATPLAVGPEDLEVRVGVELETCISLNDDNTNNSGCGVRVSDLEIQTALMSTYTDERKRWFNLITLYLNSMLRHSLEQLKDIRFETARLVNKPADLPPFTSMLDEFLRVYPKIGIKLLSKTKKIDYVVDVRALLESSASRGVPYEPEETRGSEAEDTYTMPVLTMDSSVRCSDTRGDRFIPTDYYTLHCEIITPITVLDADNILGMDVLFAALGMNCFQPNSSAGFHVNISLWSKSRGVQIPLSDQMLMNSFLDEWLPYENENYFVHRKETRRYKKRSGNTGQNPAEYARPLEIEAKKRFFNTHYNTILYDLESNALLTPEQFVDRGLYKALGNLRRRRDGRTSKYLTVLDKGGGLLEFRLFASSNIKEKLYNHIITVKDILIDAYTTYLSEAATIAEELNRLVEKVYVNYGTVSYNGPVLLPYTDSILDEGKKLWNATLDPSDRAYTDYNIGVKTYEELKGAREYDIGFEEFLEMNFGVKTYVFQMISHCLRVMDPLLTQEAYMPQVGEFAASKTAMVKEIYLCYPAGWPQETREFTLSFYKNKVDNWTLNAKVMLNKKQVPVMIKNSNYNNIFNYGTHRLGGGRRSLRKARGGGKKLKTRRRHGSR